MEEVRKSFVELVKEASKGDEERKYRITLVGTVDGMQKR